MEILDPGHTVLPKEKVARALSMKEAGKCGDATPDRDDIEMLFRCIMQMARHLAKKYGFTIKQWPEE